MVFGLWTAISGKKLYICHAHVTVLYGSCVVCVPDKWKDVHICHAKKSGQDYSCLVRYSRRVKSPPEEKRKSSSQDPGS